MKNGSPERTFWLEPDVQKFKKMSIGKTITLVGGIQKKWAECLQ